MPSPRLDALRMQLDNITEGLDGLSQETDNPNLTNAQRSRLQGVIAALRNVLSTVDQART